MKSDSVIRLHGSGRPFKASSAREAVTAGRRFAGDLYPPTWNPLLAATGSVVHLPSAIMYKSDIFHDNATAEGQSRALVRIRERCAPGAKMRFFIALAYRPRPLNFSALRQAPLFRLALRREQRAIVSFAPICFGTRRAIVNNRLISRAAAPYRRVRREAAALSRQ